MASIYRRGNVWWIKYYLHGQSIQQSLETGNKRNTPKVAGQDPASSANGHYEHAISIRSAPGSR